MKVTISFQHMKHSAATEKTILDKSQKLAKLLDGKTHLEWHCSREEGKYRLDVDVKGSHFEYHASGIEEGLASAASKAVAKIQKQLTKRKEKLTDKIHRKNEEPVFLDPESAWADAED